MGGKGGTDGHAYCGKEFFCHELDFSACASFFSAYLPTAAKCVCSIQTITGARGGGDEGKGT